MTPAFRSALAKTLGFEDGIPGPAGDIADDPRDRGGLTKWGITQRAYDAWRVTTGQGTRSVRDMTEREMQQIYFDEYWTPCRCDELPPRLDAAVFDMAVHSGVGAAKATLQRAARVKVDYHIGPVTLAAAQRLPVLVFLKKRGDFIQGVIAERPDQVVFLENWINRLLDQAWNGGAS